MTTFDCRFVARGLALTAMVSAGVLTTLRFANAVPGGESRPTLSFSGTLQGVAGMQTLTFTFKKAGATVCAPTAIATPDTNGQFTTEVPIGAPCPSTLFDGGDVVFDVSVGSTVVVRDRPVTSVPYARYADRVGTPDCPTRYDRDTSATGIVVCRKALAGGAFDEVVRVGTGPSAFWIDRYEASVWQNEDASGDRYGVGTYNYPPRYPVSGPVGRGDLVFAVSRAGVIPSGYTSWYQAESACAASGKRMPRNAEWALAAAGTIDPGVSDGAGGACVTMAGAPRTTGGGTACLSMWGAQDMIGNVLELIEEWHAAPEGPPGESLGGWGADFSGDSTYWIASQAYDNATVLRRTPSVVQRGGNWHMGTSAGTGSFVLGAGPTRAVGQESGFRCMIPR